MVTRTPVEAVVAAVRPAGAHDVLTLSVPDDPVWDRARPGQLVVEPVDPARGRVFARTHWLAGCRRDVLHGTTIEVVVPADSEPPTRWRLLGPLGRGFALPDPPVPVLLVGHGADAAPLRWLADLLRERGCPADVVLSSVDPDGHLDPAGLRRQVRAVVLSEPEETAAVVGRHLAGPGADVRVVYAVGPVEQVRPVLQAAADAACAARAAALSPDDTTCGTGLCGGCELAGADGRRARPCADGPVLPGEWLLGVTGASR